MSYQVLARKWRPQTFEDLVDQKFVALTLKNSIESGKIAHALIFSGPRGVGKTSTARIVAKAINCERKETGNYPCKENPCTTCNEISEGKSFDIQEIDAASHTGVNDIREIIENVKYMPSSTRRKVYIIDEAHMLSQSAFNALLKTLEEPPEHVLFVLATTEVHKIPATIISRCQKYDFKKISIENIKETLTRIKNEEKVDIDDKTIYLIARESDGSIRDALSLTDQLIATFDGKIKYDSVIEIVGVLDNNSLKEIVKSIFDKDSKKCLEMVQNADSKGINPKRLLNDLIDIFQNLIYLKVCGNDFISYLSDNDKTELTQIIKDESLETIDLLLNLLIDCSEKIQRSFYPNILLELTLVKLCTVNKIKNIDEIIKSIKDSPTAIDNNGNENEREKNIYSLEESTKKNLKSATENGNANRDIKNSDNSNIDRNEFINLIKEKNNFLGVMLETTTNIEIEDSNIKITFPSQDIGYDYLNKKENLENLEDISREIVLKDKINIELSEEARLTDEKPLEKNNTERNDPLVDELINIFNGKLLKSKRINKE